MVLNKYLQKEGKKEKKKEGRKEGRKIESEKARLSQPSHPGEFESERPKIYLLKNIVEFLQIMKLKS